MTNSPEHQYFERLFQEYQPMMVAFARQYVAEDEDARDVVQDVFINIWKNLGRLDAEKNVRSYLLTATKNKCFDLLKKYKNRGTSTNVGDEVISDKITSVDHLQAAELRAIIYAEVHKLPKKCQQIFLLSRENHFTYKKIAEHLGISIKTVENQMIIALKRIRKSITNYHNEGNEVRGNSILSSLFFSLIISVLGVLLNPIVYILK